MTNEERRDQLARARTNAVSWADVSEQFYAQDSDLLGEAQEMASMWARVAQALKTGDAHADTPDR